MGRPRIVSFRASRADVFPGTTKEASCGGFETGGARRTTRAFRRPRALPKRSRSIAPGNTRPRSSPSGSRPSSRAAGPAERLRGRPGAPAPVRVRAPAPSSGSAVGARHSGRLLGNLLLTRGFIVESELRYALARQAATGGAIGQILVDLGLITERDLVELLAEQFRLEVVDVGRVVCDATTIARLPGAVARRLGALPLRLSDGTVDVAVADPSDDDAVNELTEVLGAPVRLFLAPRAEIDAAVDRFYG